MSKEIEHKGKRSKLGIKLAKIKNKNKKKPNINRCLRKGIREIIKVSDLIWEKNLYQGSHEVPIKRVKDLKSFHRGKKM